MKELFNKNLVGREQYLQSIARYKALGLDVEIVDTSGPRCKIKITQSRLINGYILNQKQLVDRAKAIFSATGIKVDVLPVVFSLDVSLINLRWIESQMKTFKISRNDLVKQLAIDKENLRLLFLGEQPMNRSTKAMFYYYFLSYKINKDFRKIDFE